jgi:hypothetical protein
MTTEQKAWFSTNTKFDKNVSDEDRWRAYYHALFPDDDGYGTMNPGKSNLGPNFLPLVKPYDQIKLTHLPPHGTQNCKLCFFGP